MLATVKIRQSGYNYRLTFEVIKITNSNTVLVPWMYIFQHSLYTQINVKQTSLLTHVFLDEFSTACELLSDDLKRMKAQVHVYTF